MEEGAKIESEVMGELLLESWRGRSKPAAVGRLPK